MKLNIVERKSWSYVVWSGRKNQCG